MLKHSLLAFVTLSTLTAINPAEARTHLRQDPEPAPQIAAGAAAMADLAMESAQASQANGFQGETLCTPTARQTTLDLFTAIKKSDFEAVKVLANCKDVYVNVAHREGTPLTLAIYNSTPEIALYLISLPQIDVNKTEKNSSNLNDGSPLIVALQRFRREHAQGEEILDALLARPNINVNAYTPSYRDALMTAVQAGWESAARKLIARGANLNEVYQDAKSLLFFATPLAVDDTYVSRVELVKYLLSLPGLNGINRVDENGETVLSKDFCRAVTTGSKEIGISKAIIESGRYDLAKPIKCSSEGITEHGTPQEIAQKHGHAELLSLLR